MSETLVPRRPHLVSSQLESVRCVFVIHRWNPIPGSSDMGLGVIVQMCMKVLRAAGVHCEVCHTSGYEGLFEWLEADAARKPTRPVTHVIINTPSFIYPRTFEDLGAAFPETDFVQLNHSGMAYLSIDTDGMRNIKAVLDISQHAHNVRVAGNNRRFTRWTRDALGARSVYLPNLYDTTTFAETTTPMRNNGVLRIGSFGAGRSWKNQLVAAEAAVSMARRMGAYLELYVNVGRWDGDPRMIENRAELFEGLPFAKLIDIPWVNWSRFRKIVQSMDLLFSPSFDETYNVVTADGIAEGVPSVASGAIEWVPKSWQCAEVFDPADVVRVGMTLMNDRIGAIRDARHHLSEFVASGTRQWIRYLTGEEG